jgi:proteasome accessory factor B
MQRGHWYLTGFDRSRDADRHFRIDRIEGTVRAGEPGGYERHVAIEGVRFEPWELGDQPPRTAKVLIDAPQARWAESNLGLPAHPQADGSVILEFPVANEAAFLSTVLGFLEHAEILEPADLRSSMIAWLEALAGETR